MLILLVLFPASVFAQSAAAVHTVVIDAGHGGHDPGALGSHAREKNINLAVALKLGNLIQKNCKDVRVIYTRDRDVFVELYRRAEIANENKADLFISIHCNATENHAMQGAETYIMGLHKSKANLAIAKLENASILLESDYKSSYDGFDPNSDESYILFNLYQNANLELSTNFASAVQSQMTVREGSHDRGVRQAGFLVLYKTTMPSVLVESGYISNATDEKFLMSQEGQDFIAGSIFKAFKTVILPGKKENHATVNNTVNHDPEKKKVTGKKASDSLEYRIQVATSPTELPESARIFTVFRQVNSYKHAGLYKYTVGNFTDPEKAKETLSSIQKKGYYDAFIVIFRNNQRIPQDEANRILKK